MRERDEAQRGGEEVGVGGRCRGGGERRGEDWGAKQEAKKGERWEEGKDRWRWGDAETLMREEGEGKGGS